MNTPTLVFSEEQIALLHTGSKLNENIYPSFHLPFIFRQVSKNEKEGSISFNVLLTDSDELTKAEKEMIQFPTELDIFTVYTADEWFSRSSMRLIGVFTNNRIMVEELQKIMPEETLNDLMRNNQAVSADYNYIVESLKLNQCS